MKTEQQIKKLSEVCLIKKGKNPALSATKKEGYLPYLGAKFLRGTKVPEYAPIHDKKSVIVSREDLIIICDGSKSGDMFSGFEGVLSSTMGKIVIDSNLVNPQYLKYFLDLNFDLFNGLKKGAAIPHLDFLVFNNLEIPLPPLEEQKRIVTILDEKLGKIAEAKKLREEALRDTEKILSQTLSEIFEEGKKKGWEEKELGEVADVVGGGTPSTAISEYWDNTHAWATPKDLGKLEGVFISDTEKHISDLGLKNSSAKLLPIGSIIFSSRAPIGYLAINNVPMATNQGCRNFVCSGKLNNKFLYYSLVNKKEYIQSLGSGSTFSEISGSKLKEVTILIPALTEQKEIVKKLDELSARVASLRELQKEQLSDLKKLEKSLLREAFNGEL